MPAKPPSLPFPTSSKDQAVEVARTSGSQATPNDKGAGKSRLVRYPNPSNALRALLDQVDPKATKSIQITFKPRALRHLDLSDDVIKPSPSERSKPSAYALKLLEGATLDADPQVRPRHRKRRSASEAASAAAVQLRMAPVPVADAAPLGALVRVRRTVLALSQQDLADRAGVGRRFVSELEAGKATVEFGKVLTVCQALGISLTAEVKHGG